MSKTETKLWTLRHVREMVEDASEKVGPEMDDYDGGQKAAYEHVLKDIQIFEMIVNHSFEGTSQQDPTAGTDPINGIC